MKKLLLLIFVTAFLTSNSYSQALNEEYELQFSAGKLNTRGLLGNNAVTKDDNVMISDYDGNLMVQYSTGTKFQNNLDVNMTLTYNANVQHRIFSSNQYNNENGYMINAPEWIIGINGFAVQVLNFENNYAMTNSNFYVQNNPEDENSKFGYYLTGEQSPLLLPGYHFTNRLGDSYTDDCNVANHDNISILMADGSVKAFINTNTINYGIVVTGVYTEASFSENGIAIVEEIPNSGGLRKMYYKPGDGLTYYFVEEIARYFDPRCNFLGQACGDGKELKTMYLKAIYASNGSSLSLSYGNYNNSQSYGRREFNSVSYIAYPGAQYIIAGHLGMSKNPDDYLTELRISANNSHTIRAMILANGKNGSSLGTYALAARSNEITHTKSKYISEVIVESAPGIATVKDIFDYDIKLREFEYTKGQCITGEGPDCFYMQHPLYLVRNIASLNGKRNVFEYYGRDFEESTNTLINFALRSGSENNTNIFKTFRDCQTNAVIKKRTLYNRIEGVEEGVYEDTYNYSFDTQTEILDKGEYTTANDIPILTNIFTKITRKNISPYTSNSSNTTTFIKNFSRYNIRSLSRGKFVRGTCQGGEFFSKRIKMTEEKILEDGQLTLIKKYKYNFAAPQGWGVCGLNDDQQNNQLLGEVEVTEAGYKSRVTSYSYAFISAPLSGGTEMKIVSSKEESNYDGLVTKTDYYPGFLSNVNNNIYSVYKLNTPQFVNVYSSDGSEYKSKTEFRYSPETNVGNDKIEEILYEDVDITGRVKVKEYQYNSDNNYYKGTIKKIITNPNYPNSRLEENYFYAPLKEGHPFAVEYEIFEPIKFVKSDNSIVIPESYTPENSIYSHSPYIIEKKYNFSPYVSIYSQGENLNLMKYEHFEGYYKIYSIDENGFFSQFELDLLYRKVNNKMPGSWVIAPRGPYESGTSFNSSAISYDDINKTITEINRFNQDPNDFREYKTVQKYDALGRLRKVIVFDDLGNPEVKSIKNYDYKGNLIEEIDGENRKKVYNYDYNNKIKKIKYDGATTSQEYYYHPAPHSAEFYELVQFTDESGNTKETYYDISGKVLEEKLENNAPTKFIYNSINQLEQVISPLGQNTYYNYDGFGNISYKSSKDEGTYQYEYDLEGNLRFQHHDGDQFTYFFSYDQLNRLVAKGITSSTLSGLYPDVGNSEEFNDANKVLVNMYDIYKPVGVFANIQLPKGFVPENLKGRLTATAYRDDTSSSWKYKIYSYDYMGRVKETKILE